MRTKAIHLIPHQWAGCTEFPKKMMKSILSAILMKSFFAGYDPLTHKRAKGETATLILQGAHKIPCENTEGKPLDVLSLCKDRKNIRGVTVFAETTSYQDRLQKTMPHQYEYFLNNGFEVIVWNPATPRFTNRSYSNDLSSVLKKIKSLVTENTPLLVKAHCAAVEPTIAAATTLPDHRFVTLILDRGYLDAGLLARSTTIVCQLPFIKKLIQEEFACNGEENLKKFSGKIIWIAPKNLSADQMMYWPKTGENLTHKMRILWSTIRPSTNNQSIELGGHSDHWSHWEKEDYEAISQALVRMQVVSEPLIAPLPSPNRQVPFCRKRMMPFLNKAWC